MASKQAQKMLYLVVALTLVLAFIYLTTSTSTVHADTLTVTISASNSVFVQGGSSTLSISGVPSSGSYTYQWYAGPNGDLTPTTDTTNTYTFTTSSSTTPGVYGFGVIVTDATGTQTYSPELDISVVAASASSAVVFAGPDAGTIIQVDGLGSGSYQYQWYEQAPGGSWTAISGATSASLPFAVPDGTAIGEWNFQVEIMDSSSNILATPQTSVAVASFSASNSVVVQGGSTTLTILGVPNDGSYTYQWYAGPSGDLSPVTGVTSNTYTFTTSSSTTIGTYVFGVIVTSSATETQVNAPVLDIPVVALSASPTVVFTGSNSGTIIQVNGLGSGNYQYQWYQQAPGGTWTPIPGATSATLPFPTPASTTTGVWNFELEIMDSSANLLASPQISVIVASFSASNSVVVQGGSTTLTISGVPNDGSYTYQWYAGPNGDLTPTTDTTNTYTFTTDTSTTLGTYGFGVIITSSSTKTQIDAPELNIQVIAAPTATNTASISGGSVTIDQSGTTGASIAINNQNLPDGTSITLTSTYYQQTLPSASGALLSGGTAYFDVEVTSNPVGALTGVNVVVSLTDESFTSSSILYYWVGGSWQPVPDQTFVAPNTLQATVPASLLSGTPFAGGVGQPLVTAPENGFGVLLSFAACAAALATYVGGRQIGKSRSRRM